MVNIKRINDQLAKVIDLFSTKDLPEYIARDYLESKDKPSKKWSLGNRLLMMWNCTRDARGIKQWRDTGRTIKKGSKAIYILGPNTRKIIKKDDDGEEIEITAIVGFRNIPVFRYEDTEGCELKEVINPPKQLPPLAKVAEKWNIKIRYDGTNDGERGSFNPHQKEIRLCTADDTVFFHELAHAAHGRFEKLKLVQDVEQEAIAQITSCVLGRIYGMNVDNYSCTYLKQYGKTNSPEKVGKLCYRVAGKVEKILKMILEEAETIEKAPIVTK